MLHPLVEQLQFTRSEWLRGLEGISEEDGARHIGPMNCISWIVGHLAWQEVIQASQSYVDSLTTQSLQQELPLEGKPVGQSIGSAMRRMTYHYWYHIGEMQAIRQMLGHTGLPEYVGDIERLAPYKPEP